MDTYTPGQVRQRRTDVHRFVSDLNSDSGKRELALRFHTLSGFIGDNPANATLGPKQQHLLSVATNKLASRICRTLSTDPATLIAYSEQEHWQESRAGAEMLLKEELPYRSRLTAENLSRLMIILASLPSGAGNNDTKF